jgi:hypothetical protein
VTNNNTQTGTTGDATVDGNTTGGSAISGNVNNNNTTSTSVSINNAGGMGGGSTPSNNVTPAADKGAVVAKLQQLRCLPRTGGGGINDMLLSALMNARQGVISPLAKTGADWSWSLTLLAGMLALAATYGYSKLQNRKFAAQLTQTV